MSCCLDRRDLSIVIVAPNDLKLSHVAVVKTHKCFIAALLISGVEGHSAAHIVNSDTCFCYIMHE